MIKIAKTSLLAIGFMLLPYQAANAHPHVFVETSIEIVRNNEGAFSELRHVWRFDELFSAMMTLDFDANANGKLDPEELKEITDTVIKSIADYDYYTAMRAGEEVIEFYAPEELNAYMEGGQMIMLLSLEPSKPYGFDKGPLKISASDTSYYVAFEMNQENMKVSGKDAGSCNVDTTHPDFDKLYAENSQTLSEAFFDDAENNTLDLGDEFYSWVNVTC